MDLSDWHNWGWFIAIAWLAWLVIDTNNKVSALKTQMNALIRKLYPEAFEDD